MNVLVTGAAGQLGRHLLAGPLAAQTEVVSSARSTGDYPCDLGDEAAVAGLLETVNPSIIVNAAAYTAVDAAEDDPEGADRLNHQLPAWLSAWCVQNGALLIHYSTDYVFSGQAARPWREDDPTAPQSVYGASKLAGEQAILSSAAQAWIVRTAWVYSACPGNFLSAILARAAQGQDLRVVDDQVGSPTWAGTLAAATGSLLDARTQRPDRPRTLHVSGRGQASWYNFAEMAVTMAAARGLIKRKVAVQPISSAEWPQKASRPAWSVLDCRRYENLTGHPLPEIAAGLGDCLDNWNNAPC